MKFLYLAAFIAALAFASHTATAQQTVNVQQGTAEINGAQIHYQMAGQGQPLVLIHGYPLSSGLFRDQLSGLSDRFQVIAPDLRGFGQSTTPNDQGSIELYADDVLALMDQLGIGQAIIGGHSMGGIITLQMYRQAPERFLGMVLIDTVAAAAPVQEQFLWRGYARQAEVNGVATFPPLLLDELLSGTTRQNNPRLVNHMSGIIKEASQDAAIAGGNALATRPDYTSMLSQITVPTFILFGVEDTVTPIPFAGVFKQSIPNSTLLLIQDASHAANIEKSQQANQALEQWASGEVPSPTPQPLSGS